VLDSKYYFDPELIYSTAQLRSDSQHLRSSGVSIATTEHSESATMSPSIEELDATVRAFYEGRGDTVSDQLHTCAQRKYTNAFFHIAKGGSDEAEYV